MLKLQSIKLPKLTFSIILLLLVVYSSACKVTKSKDITYMNEGFYTNLPEKQLNIFSPTKATEAKPVLIFVHGGSWNSGSKDLYDY